MTTTAAGPVVSDGNSAALRVTVVTDREAIYSRSGQQARVIYDPAGRTIGIAAGDRGDFGEACRCIADVLSEMPGVVVTRGKCEDVIDAEERIVPGVWVASDHPLRDALAGRVLLVTREGDRPRGLIALVIPTNPASDESVKNAIALCRRLRTGAAERLFTCIAGGTEQVIDLRGLGSIDSARPTPPWLFALRLLPCMGSGNGAECHGYRHPQVFCPTMYAQLRKMRNEMLEQANRCADRVVGEVTAKGDLIDLKVEDYASGMFGVKSIDALVARRSRKLDVEKRRTPRAPSPKARVVVNAAAVQKSKQGRTGARPHVTSR